MQQQKPEHIDPKLVAAQIEINGTTNSDNQIRIQVHLHSKHFIATVNSFSPRKATFQQFVCK